MIETKTETPLMKQYLSLKKKNKDSILFFRLGDFYEMFEDDAKIASSVLSLTLTSRQKVPMCGIPYHSATNYIKRLIEKGYSVAICEQVGSEDLKTKLFKREVVRIITPGTIIEDELLEKKSSNYLLTIISDIVGWGLSYGDISTGEFYALQNLNDPDFYQLYSLISRINPSEIISDSKTISYLNSKGFKTKENIKEYRDDSQQEYDWLKNHIWQNNKLAQKSALFYLNYIKRNNPSLKIFPEPTFFEDEKIMKLDETAIKTLELVSPSYEGGSSLWEILDATKTSMGSRMLRRWVLNPLNDFYSIKKRQDLVNFLFENKELRNQLGNILENIMDIERISGRIHNFSTTPRDLIAISKAINFLPKIKLLLSRDDFFQFANDIYNKLDKLNDLIILKEEIEKAIIEEAPIKTSDGGFIKDSFNKDLDELRNIRKNTREIILQIENEEKEKNQIPSLKISYTNNFGYFIEVTKTHLSKVPSYYQRKQTLTNAERFTTLKLKELEDKILGAQDKIIKLENLIFNELKEKVFNKLKSLKEFAYSIASLDVYFSLSEISEKNNYVKPEITTENKIEIEEGRHPVVEKYIPEGEFVPNDFNIGENHYKTIILTGPNMSGKSVYLRQNALITIMAQIGSFVSAKKAKIGLTDRIMTRIGAQDRLSKGESTFMVEMKETAEILKKASSKTLVLLDEIGRGTSTFDGISIAWAITEELYNNNKANVVFATHYFELTELSKKYTEIKNFNISVKEWVNSKGIKEVVFLHRIEIGPADKSYGIHVAQLAGLSNNAIKRAKEILLKLENKTEINTLNNSNNNQEMLPFIEKNNPIIDKINSIDINSLTPLEALNILNEIKNDILK